MRTDALSSPDLELLVLGSRAEVLAVRERVHDRLAFENLLNDGLGRDDEGRLPGYCQACDEPVVFRYDWQSADLPYLNFRERLVCPRCGLNTRQRLVAHLLRKVVSARAEAPVYLYEQVTPFFHWAQRTLDVPLIGSEYLGHDVPGGTEVEGIRHEDALALSFDDASLEVVVSNDVFEHVPDIDRSLVECVRVLRPGGSLFFSIPFHETLDETVQRAALTGGEVEHLLPPVYHGDPVGDGKSLVFYDHAWDILERCRRAGFAEAHVIGYWSALYGYLGGGLQLTFVARR